MTVTFPGARALRAALPLAIAVLLAAVPAALAAGDSGTVGGFSYGELTTASVGASGCGTNDAGEPAIHVSPANDVFLSSERGLPAGTDVWRGLGAVGGASASGCGLEFRGEPNAVQGAGAAGGDTDLAIGTVKSGSSYPLYVASLWLGSVSVAHSNDDGSTFTNVPVVAGLPVDDREWIAAYRDKTSLLTYHDIATNNIDVMRSDDGGTAYVQIARAIDDSDYRSSFNELGNVAIDQVDTAGASDFWAYQSFVAPSKDPGSNGPTENNEAFVSVSSDGGHTWTPRPIACSTSQESLDHAFPNVSVGPSGDIWETWSDDTNVYAAVSTDHGDSWSCSGPIGTGSGQAIYPWIVATSAGEDLVFYGTTTPASQSAQQDWYVYFAQNTGSGWGSPQQLMKVHHGGVCEQGVSCNGGRQLLDDFGVDTDSQGWAHIAYTHDSPGYGDSGSYTGYAVQTAGTQVGASMTSTPASGSASGGAVAAQTATTQPSASSPSSSAATAAAPKGGGTAPSGATAGSASHRAPACVVPRVKGRTLAAARRKLAARHCRLGHVARRRGARGRTGRVLAQSPRPGSKRSAGARVRVTIRTR